MTDQQLLWAILAGPSGYLPVRFPGGSVFCPVGATAKWRRLCTGLGWHGDLEVCAVPTLDPNWRFHGDSSVLWARVESKASAARLARFDPAPTLVLREGSSARRVALWALCAPLGRGWTERANRRIAHALGGPKKWCGESFSFPVPGTVLRVGRSRPVPVVVESRCDGLYRPREVVGGLREAPDPEAWREWA